MAVFTKVGVPVGALVMAEAPEGFTVGVSMAGGLGVWVGVKEGLKFAP